MTTLWRSAKYFIRLGVLCTALVVVMHLAGMLAVPIGDLPILLFATWRGWVLIAAMVILSAIYPWTGFTTRRVEGQIDEDRERILTAFHQEGFSFRGEAEETMRFRAASPLRRLMLLGDDEVQVTQYGQWIELHGLRRTVARVAPRLEGYIAAAARDKK